MTTSNKVGWNIANRLLSLFKIRCYRKASFLSNVRKGELSGASLMASARVTMTKQAAADDARRERFTGAGALLLARRAGVGALLLARRASRWG